jgi:hypothetical protein
MLIYEITVTPYYVIYYSIMVNIPICYSNSTIVNIYWHCRKLVYKIIVNIYSWLLKLASFLNNMSYVHVRMWGSWENTYCRIEPPPGRVQDGLYHHVDSELTYKPKHYIYCFLISLPSAALAFVNVPPANASNCRATVSSSRAADSAH